MISSAACIFLIIKFINIIARRSYEQLADSFDAEISSEPIGTTKDTSMRREITASILSIIAERDDLVTSESTLAG
jgi:hypothetical protein